jgi:glutamine synthetase type III
MAKAKGLEVDRRVGIALSVLPSVQKHAVERVIQSPRSFATAAAVPGRVQQMRISRSLRLIYTMVGDTVYVVDVVERATLKHFASRKAATKATKADVAKKAQKVVAKKASNALKK